MSINQLMFHYHTYGKAEGRWICKKNFYEAYPDFDVNFYKLFNKDFIQSNMNINQLMKHYDNIINISKKFFEYDLTIGENYNYVKNNFSKVTNNLINCHYFYRKIDNFKDLLEYNKEYIKNYYFFNKKSFYKYYSDFDYEYYKNRYFKDNNEITENEILHYYHTKGKYEGNSTNDKITIIIYTPPYNIKIGGIIVMHYFAKLVNKKCNNKFRAKLFMYNNIRYENPFCNDFAKIDEINENTVVIYPEVISGNPLNAKHVVRWILLELGIEMPLDHYKNWGINDLVYFWETIVNIKNYSQLCCPFLNPLFKNNNSNERTNTCYLVKKGPLIHKNINYIHPTESICIDDFSLEEINRTFNICKYFYCYDPNSAYTIYSAICGCIPIIYPIDDLDENDYFKNKIYNFNNNIFSRGIVYGNDENKIKYILENKLYEENLEYYKDLFDKHENTIDKFLVDIDCLINNRRQLTNTVEEVFN